VRRESLWLTFTDVNVTLGAGVSVLGFSLNAAALALLPFTVVRTRGYLFARSDQILAPETYGYSFGIAVVSAQAAAIGVTAVPTPVTDRGSDLFFVYESLMGRFEFDTSAAWGEVGHFKEFDSKAMRKVQNAEDVVVTFENSAISSDTVIASAGLRMLIKLH